MEELESVVFYIGEGKYAIDIEEVKGIENNVEISPVPNKPAYLLGLINLRGEVIPVFSLRDKFKIEEEYNNLQKLIVVSIDGSKVAFKVDSVIGIYDVDKDKAYDVPVVVKSDATKYVKKVFKVENELVILIDLENVLEEAELKELNEAVKEHNKAN